MSASTTLDGSSRTTEKAESPAPSARPRRRRTPLLVAGLAVAALLGAGAWHVTHVGRESTDDAQVEGRVMSVSARVSGQVLHVRVTDDQEVNAGDVLLELDPADYRAKVERARADLAAAQANAHSAAAALAITMKTAPANLAQARGGIVSASSTRDSAKTAIEQAKASVAAAQARRDLAQLELARSQKLLSQEAISVAEVDVRRTELDAANAALSEAEARLASADAQLEGSSGNVTLAQGRLSAAQTADEQIESAKAAVELANAHLEQAKATLDLAELDLSYTSVRAPRRGVVSRRSVEEGQSVSPERPLLAIVPRDDVWIVANFKEDQIGAMAVGNKADVEIDTYSGHRLHAHVASIAEGTGARFALLPPDNATGNFVKVVQRVPVLLRMDDTAGLELRPGMSADVTVDTR